MAGDETMSQAVFLDRDGTIIEEKHYLCRVEDVVIFPGAAAALARLQRAGFKLFIVSNQSGVGRGYFTLAEVEKVNEYLLRELGREGVRFEKVYIAPEAPGRAQPRPQAVAAIPAGCARRVRRGPGAELHDWRQAD